MKPVIAIAAAALSLAVPVVASGGPPRDSAVGSGTTGGKSSPTGEQHVAFAAFGGPTTFDPFTQAIGGDPVTGHFTASGDFGSSLTAFQQEGPVTCLAVDGNRATLVYPNKQARPGTNEAFDTLIFLEDNGKPQNGRPRDRVGFALVPDTTPNDDPPSDALATPMYDAFARTPDVAGTRYAAVQPKQRLKEVNGASAPDVRLSAALPFNRPDVVPQAVLDRILWHAVHGQASRPPAPGPNASTAEHERATEALRAFRSHRDVRRVLSGAAPDGGG
jgi:hypothetical protein